jgi:alpha-tubulin suppressor-like RCC1 family protein
LLLEVFIKNGINIIYNFANISSTESAFAAIKSNGDIITWGNQDNGGDLHTWGLDFNIDPPEIQIPVVPTTITGNNLKFIVATSKAFCEITQTSNNNAISIYRTNENIDLGNIKKIIPLELLKYAIYNNIQIYLE